MSFQWDILLLEAGTILSMMVPLLPYLPSYHKSLVLYLNRFLLFKLVFMSGVVKLQARCDTWWNLTALDWHFQSQCIPTPLSQYMHFFPKWLLRLSTVSTYIFLIGFGLLALLPFRTTSIMAFYLLNFLQLLILSTGNYNWFNLHTMVLAISLLDDDHLEWLSSLISRMPEKKDYSVSFISHVEVLISAGCVAFILYKSYVIFNMNFLTWPMSVEMNFSPREFNDWVDYILPHALHLAAANMVCLAVATFIRASFSPNPISSILFVALAIGFTVFIYVLSLPTFNSVSRGVHERIQFWRPEATEVFKMMRNYQLASSYGLFRSMTGVGGRPEVVLEASVDGTEYHEIEFLYKPTSLNQSCPFLIPHQPRVDWQMWFAALGSFNGRRGMWLQAFALRLLQGSKDVIGLLDKRRWPFRENSPKFIRGWHYAYHFQDPWVETDTRIWRRNQKKMHFPAMNEDQLRSRYVRHLTSLDFPDEHLEDDWWYQIVIIIREEMTKRRPEHLMWGSFLALVIAKWSVAFIF